MKKQITPHPGTPLPVVQRVMVRAEQSYPHPHNPEHAAKVTIELDAVYSHTVTIPQMNAGAVDLLAAAWQVIDDDIERRIEAIARDQNAARLYDPHGDFADDNDTEAFG